jgi:TATA-box binding protein (TBP) (component of TFIID and TFIIIB)
MASASSIPSVDRDHTNEKPKDLHIVNFVCTAEFLDTQLDLIRVAEAFQGKFGKRAQQAVVIRSLRPKLTCMLMANGKMLICGGQSPEEGVCLANLIALKLERNYLVPRGSCVSNFVVQNIVCKYYCGHMMNVALFYADHMDTSVYHPDKIKPVRHYPPGTKQVIVIYSSGNCIITGAIEQKQLYQGTTKVAWQKYKLGHEYRPFEIQQITKPKKPKLKKCKQPGCKAKQVDIYCMKHDPLLETKTKPLPQVENVDDAVDELEMEMLEAIAVTMQPTQPHGKKRKVQCESCESGSNEFCSEHNSNNNVKKPRV